MLALDVDDVIAHLLVAEGFTRIEEVAETPIEELNEIEGFEEEVSIELQNRAIAFLDMKAKELSDKQEELKIEDSLMEFTGLTNDQILLVAEKGVKTLDDLADLAGDELVEMLGEGHLTENQANKVIMQARAHWFEDEDNAAAEAAAAEAAENGEDTEGEADATKTVDAPLEAPSVSEHGDLSPAHWPDAPSKDKDA